MFNKYLGKAKMLIYFDIGTIPMKVRIARYFLEPINKLRCFHMNDLVIYLTHNGSGANRIFLTLPYPEEFDRVLLHPNLRPFDTLRLLKVVYHESIGFLRYICFMSLFMECIT